MAASPVDLNGADYLDSRPLNVYALPGQNISRDCSWNRQKNVVTRFGLTRRVVWLRRGSGMPIDIGAVKDYVAAVFVRPFR